MSTSRARELRNSMSPPEVLLWSRLKRLRAQGFHFRRQTPFRGYYLDFVCFSRRLVVEVDGGQHAEDEAARHDAVRDAVLRREGFQVMRFWAGTVMASRARSWMQLRMLWRGDRLSGPHPDRFAVCPSP